jgi:hypothetical protein
VIGQELLKFLLQPAGHRGRLVGAIGQNLPDLLEDGPADLFVLRHPNSSGG